MEVLPFLIIYIVSPLRDNRFLPGRAAWTHPSFPLPVQAGVGAILVGESLVKQGDPAAGIRTLLSLE